MLRTDLLEDPRRDRQVDDENARGATIIRQKSTPTTADN
jgi:hypothetical protein